MAISGIFLATSLTSADVSIGGPFNCDSNAVIYCGASSASHVTSVYQNGDGVNSASSIQNIFSFFGISSAEIQNLPNTAVVGSVTSSGDVYIGSQLVATNVTTGGRDFIAGSTSQTYNGTTFYTRPPSVSFLSSPLSAYVVMSNGVFQFAILSSCGNPVTGTPTTTPPPAPVQPTPPPSASCTSLELSQSSTNPKQVQAQADYQVQNGASLNTASFNWGDGSEPTTPSNSNTASYMYQQPGNYTVTATLTFNGSPSVPESTCQAQITIPSPPAATPTVQVTSAPPAPPTTLPSTGPGNTIGLFVGTTASGYFGFLGYKQLKLRQLPKHLIKNLMTILHP